MTMFWLIFFLYMQKINLCFSALEFMKIYKKLEIEDLVDRGESFYQELMAPVVSALDKAGMS